MVKEEAENSYEEEEEISVTKGKKGNVTLEDISGIGPATAKN